MLPPIEPGTLLNQRYRALQLLNQTEFYRTYLACDEGRFNESCTLEEISLNPQATPEVREKSAECFQREASKLYRLQHRQLPQVQATFEHDHRWFLVLSHIEGQTLGELLQVRRGHEATFGEAEVQQLLEGLLPVLDYVHRHNIVHGNITPETIVLRSAPGVSFEETEGEPVLIHFGAIADLANR
ncbi:MAG: serine/threonine protein kinase, partial [Cyanobacteriota bacterium]|nr:serine/threonine protein kinase [Cyanobacteriota bacterium]